MRPVTVDCIIFTADGVVLVRRGHPPFEGYYALPGGFVEVGETVEEACVRETREETSLTVSDLQLIGVYSDPIRDPDRHTVALAYLGKATDLSTLKSGDDAKDVQVVSDWKNERLAFDHARILEDAWQLLNKR